ncbi:hypothetical protein AK88_02280 [Plasmodium fragile]|uniref:Uncharacterized protein n=1 Tax=Plasmodium fragile TaxID=5857 RepID=A0A0D9QLQ0_PLAFR|nr:uncharacterized protein AK88_02280 [Plasmodium fragile]KJP88005.1 hypothetical protein AK88_02280 [Plasmodium fragile]
MEKAKCIICGSTSFRIEEAQVVCNQCNYVSEIQQEQFEDDYEERQLDDHVDKEYLEKDFYEILKKLYKNDKLVNKIKNYVFKENDEFFLKYQKVLLNVMYVFVAEHHLPPLLYDEVKKIWFYLLKVNIMNTNVYVPMGDAKGSVKSVFEVIRAQKLKDIVMDILNKGNVIHVMKNVIKKIGLSKLSYFFIIQKKIINETSKSLEFLPKKSEVHRRSEFKLLNLYKQTALLESEKKNKEDFLKINEIIHNIRKSKLDNQEEEPDQDGDQNFAISNVSAHAGGGYASHGKREEGMLSDHQLMEATSRPKSLNDNYEHFDAYERDDDGDELFNLGDLAEFDQFGHLDEIDQVDPLGQLDSNDRPPTPQDTQGPKNAENFTQDENYTQAERVYHFHSSFIINQLLKNKKLFRPVDSNVSTNYMNRSINHTNVIDLIYQHDFLYYFHEELRKKCDIEFLSFYDIIQVFKGEYDYLLPPSLGLPTGPYIPTSERGTSERGTSERGTSEGSPPKEDVCAQENHVQQESHLDELAQVHDESGDSFGLEMNETPLHEELKMEQSFLDVPLTGDQREKTPLQNSDEEQSSIVESLRDNVSLGGEVSEFHGPNDADSSGGKVEAGDQFGFNHLEGLYEEGLEEGSEHNALLEMLKNDELKNDELKNDELKNDQLKKETATNKKHQRSSEDVEKIMNNYQKYIELLKASGKPVLRNERTVLIGTLSDDERMETTNEQKKETKKKGGGAQEGKNAIDRPEEREEDTDLLGNLSPLINEISDAAPVYDVKGVSPSRSGVPSSGGSKASALLLQMETAVGRKKSDIGHVKRGPSNASLVTSIHTVYKKLEHVNNIKREKNITIEKHYYDNGLKKTQKNYSKIDLFVKECILKQIKEENFKSENEKMLYIPDKYLIDSYIFDGLYENFLYISNLNRFRTITIKHVYGEYINFFLKDYKEYLIDEEAYKFCYNFSFDLLLYLLYYSMKRLQIQCLPHNLTNYINLDIFNLYRVFNNVPELLQKIYKDESSLFSFPLKNTNFSEIKKSFFLRNLKNGVPFLCMHNYEHTSKHFTHEEEYQLKASPPKNKLHTITYFKNGKNLNMANKLLSKFRNAEWVKDVQLFNSTLITDLYGQINDLVFKFQLPNVVQIYSMKLLHMIIFKYRFFKFLFNVYSNQYDDMHNELNNFYSFKHILRDFKMFYRKRNRCLFSEKEINKYILYLMKKELYLKKKILKKKKYIHKKSGQLNYKVYNKLNYFYRQKFICTFFITLRFSLSVEKKKFYSIAAACVLTACKFYYPMLNSDFFNFQNMFVPDKYESFHRANHYQCHLQQGVHLYNGADLQERPHRRGKHRTKQVKKWDGRDVPAGEPPLDDKALHSEVKAALKRTCRREREGKRAMNKTDKTEQPISSANPPDRRKRKLFSPLGELDSTKRGLESKRAKRGGIICEEEVPPLGDGSLVGESLIDEELMGDPMGENHADYPYDHYSDIFTYVSDEESFLRSSDEGATGLGEKELERFLSQDDSDCDSAYVACHREIIFEEAPMERATCQKGRKTKMKRHPNVLIRRIHFKASTQKSNFYFVPIPSIMKLFFNYRRFSSDDTTLDSLLQGNLSRAGSSSDETDDEEQYMSHIAAQANCSRPIARKGSTGNVKRKRISKQENLSRKPKYLKVNKYLVPPIYIFTVLQNVSCSGKNRSRHKEKTVVDLSELVVYQNPYCCKGLLDAPPRRVSPLERKVNQLKERLFRTLCLSYCPQHVDHFNFDMKKILFYNAMGRMMVECGLSPHEAEAHNVLRAESSEWFALLKMVSCWGGQGTREYSHWGKNPSGSFMSNVDEDLFRGDAAKGGEKDASGQAGIGDGIDMDSRPSAKHDGKDEDHFVNFNDETVEHFIRANSLARREKKLYRALKKQSNDMGGEDATGVTDAKLQIIKQRHLIHSKRYEIVFFRYVMYEYNTILHLLPDFHFMVDTLNVFVTCTWNVYHILFLYYQIKHTMNEFFKCFTQIINMVDYFLLIMKRKEYMPAEQFNCFFRNKYRKKKKKISHNIKKLFFVFELLSAVYGVKCKIPYQFKFTPGAFSVNNCTLIYYRKKPDSAEVSKKNEYFAHLSNLFYGGYYEYLNNMLKNVFNLEMVKRTLKRKMRQARNALHNSIRNSYMFNDYIHSYLFPPTRKTLFHITVRHVNFFSLSFEGTLRLVRKNYAPFLDQYYEAIDRCGLSSMGDVVTVLSVSPSHEGLHIRTSKGANRGGNYPIICSPKRRRNAHRIISKYLTLTLNMQQEKTRVPYLFCDNRAASNWTKDSSVYFLHHDRSDVIHDCIDFVMRKNYRVLNNTQLCDILKYKVMVDVQGQACNQLEWSQNEDAGSRIFQSTCYDIEPDTASYHIVKLFKYLKKMRRIITHPRDVFLLYYLSYCTNLFKKNLLSRSELYTNNYLARRVLYSFLPGLLRRNKKSNKNSVIMKNKIINYVQLFKFILRGSRNTFLGSEGGIFVSICDPCSCNSPSHFGEKKNILQNCPPPDGEKSNSTSIWCEEQFQSTLPLQRNKKWESVDGTKWLKLVDLSQSYTKFAKRLRCPVSNTNELLFNKIIFFNLANETVINDVWQGGRHVPPAQIGQICNRNGENPSREYKRKWRGPQVRRTSEVITPLQTIAYSIILDNFINNNRQLILIKNVDRFHANLEEKIERKFYKMRNGIRGGTANGSSSGTTYGTTNGITYGTKNGITNGIKYSAHKKLYTKSNVLTSTIHQMDSMINKLPYSILPKEDPIKSIVTLEMPSAHNKENVVEAIDSISSIHSKLFTNLNYLLCTVPLDGYLISYLEKRLAEMFPKEDLKEELCDFVHDILVKLNMNVSNGGDAPQVHPQGGNNHPRETDHGRRDPHENDPKDAPTGEDEFLYLSTDVDSYKTDSMYPLHQLRKNKTYHDLKKFFKKNQIQLNIAMEKKESCDVNRCTSFFKQSQRSRSNAIIVNECYRIFANVFSKLSSCLSQLDDRDICGAPFYRRLFEWYSNLNMYDPFLLIHNKHYEYDGAIMGGSSGVYASYKAEEKDPSIINGDKNGRLFSGVMRKGKLAENCNTWGRRLHAEPHICIYNDNTFFNANDESLAAEVAKGDKYEESLINYSLNKNSHFEFRPNVNSFTLRLKNDYIKKKNKKIYQHVQKKQIHKVKYVQNVVRTGKYTYFFFSCLVYPMSHVPRIMYLFSIRYFPSLFIKTANYLNYLNVDSHMLQFLSSCDVSTIKEIFKNIRKQKSSENIFHLLRFRGFYVNPFSLLGSIYYSKDIELLCTNFKLSLCSYINTLHTVLSVENTKRDFKAVNQERDKQDHISPHVADMRLDRAQIGQNSSEMDPDVLGLYQNQFSEIPDPLDLSRMDHFDNSVTETYIKATIKFADDEKNNIHDDKINNFFKKINRRDSGAFSKRSREMRNIALFENTMRNEGKQNQDSRDMFFSSEMNEILSKQNIIEDDEDNESEGFLQRARNFNFLSTIPNVLALRPVERGAKKRRQRQQQILVERKLDSRPSSVSKRFADLPPDRSHSEQLVHIETEDQSNMKYYLFGDDETNILSVIGQGEQASKPAAGSGHSRAKDTHKGEAVTENIVEMAGRADSTLTQNIPAPNDRDTNDCLSEQQLEMFNLCVEQGQRDDSQSDLYGGSHVAGSVASRNWSQNMSVAASHSASWNESRSASFFSRSHNPSMNQMGVRKMGVHKVGKGGNRFTRGRCFKRASRPQKSMPSKGAKRIYDKCLRKHLDTEIAQPFSTPSETINLYNIILNSLNNEILLKNDSITYGKYIKKTPLEFNYIVYKEFSTHTSYYSEPYDKSVLNEFIDIFYTDKFRDNYLAGPGGEEKLAGETVGILDQGEEVGVLDKGEEAGVLDSARGDPFPVTPREGSEGRSQVDEFFCLNDELFSSGGAEAPFPGERAGSESDLQNDLQNHLDNDPQNDLQSDRQSDHLGGGESDAHEEEDNIRSMLNPYWEDENLLENVQTEQKDVIDMEETNEEHINHEEESTISVFSDDYYDSNAESEENDLHQDSYTVCSFYLHKPVYIFDEQSEINKVEKETHKKRDIKNDNTPSAADPKIIDDNLFFPLNKNAISKYMTKNDKKLKKVYKKLIKKMEYDKNAKRTSYAIYDKKNNFLLYDYKCSMYKNIWGKFTKKYVRKKKYIHMNKLFNGNNLIVNTISNDIYPYDKEVRKVVQIYKRNKLFIKNAKQRHISSKYKHSFPWVGDNMLVCPNDVDLFIMAGYSSILTHQNTSYLKNFNYHSANAFIPLYCKTLSRNLEHLSTMMCLLIKAFSSYLGCPSNDLITACKEVEGIFFRFCL